MENHLEIDNEFERIFALCKRDASTVAAVRQAVISDLENALRPLKVRLYLYGSMVTTLDLSDSDCDFFMVSETADANKRPTALQEVLQTLQSNDLFDKFVDMSDVRVPIIRCVHRPTGMKIDLNNSCPQALFKTAVLAAVARSDRRLHDFFVFLKIWSKQSTLIDNLIVTHYCLMLLAIFYLQQSVAACILPPLKQLLEPQAIDYQRYADRDYEYKVPVGLLRIPDSFATWQAIKGFFAYFSSLPFEGITLHTYEGRAMARLPQHDNAPMWVVDDDEARNKAGFVDDFHFRNFRTALQIADKICRNRSKDQTAADIYEAIAFGSHAASSTTETLLTQAAIGL